MGEGEGDRRGARLVAFLGIDGSGKTTQARLLVSWLESRGRPAVYRRSEGGRFALDAIARRRLRAGRLAEVVGPREAGLMEAAVRWKSIRAIEDDLARPDLFVVADRYAPCQYALSRSKGRDEALVRALFADFPAPALSLFVDVPPEVAWRRVHARGIDEEEVELLASFRRAYYELPEAASFTVVDGTRPVEEVHAEIVRHLVEHLPDLG